MVGAICAATKSEVSEAIRSRYREASRKDKSRMPDEFVAITGCHRKQAVRLLGQCKEANGRTHYHRWPASNRAASPNTVRLSSRCLYHLDN